MKKSLNKLYIKIILVNVVDLVVVLATVFFLSRMPSIAAQISKLHGQALAGEQSSEGAVIKADIEREREKITTLSNLFLDDTGLVHFNGELARLKSANIVTDTTFVSTTPITDLTGAHGLPLLFKINGTRDQINTAVKEVTNLPALIRPVTVKLTKNDAGLTLEYGVFVYIK